MLSKFAFFFNEDFFPSKKAACSKGSLAFLWSGNYRNLWQGSSKKALTMTKESQTHIRNR
jgi:hypothetical protein